MSIVFLSNQSILFYLCLFVPYSLISCVYLHVTTVSYVLHSIIPISYFCLNTMQVLVKVRVKVKYSFHFELKQKKN
jgi:hypothetical protein